MRYRIVKWHDYQHYGQRCPPWIKLHYDVLTSRTWVSLDDAGRVLAIACMLLASRDEAKNGEFDGNPRFMERVAYLNQPPDFGPLVDLGFLELVSPASPSQDPEETETEQRQRQMRARESACNALASASKGRAGAASAASSFPVRELKQDDTAETAYQCLCAIRPEYANLNMSAFYAAWKNESDPSYRCRAFNDCLMKLAGAIDTHKEPLALLAGYLRNARTKSTGPRTSDLASVIDPVDE